MLLWLAIILGGGLLGIGIFWNKWEETRSMDRGPVCTAVGSIILFVLGMAFVASQLQVIYENGCLVVAKQNIEAYRKTAVEINALAVVQHIADGKMIGGLENLKQSTMASQALLEYRDMVKEYNDVIGYRKVILNDAWLCSFVQPLAEGIEVIEFRLKEESKIYKTKPWGN